MPSIVKHLSSIEDCMMCTFPRKSSNKPIQRPQRIEEYLVKGLSSRIGTLQAKETCTTTVK